MSNPALDKLLGNRLRLPLIAAPMFRVSGIDLVKAACKAGIIGAFPTANCRSPNELDEWLQELKASECANDAPFCANLIMRRSTLKAELDVLCQNQVELVITSVGSPAPVIPALREAGCLIFADVASVGHARKAIDAGADGLILLGSGAGGQTGWANGIAFVRAVRRFFNGPVVLAGGISDGHGMLAAIASGADLAYMGTRFIATKESQATSAYKDMLVQSELDDVLLTPAFTGLESNMLRPSILAAGLSPDDLPNSVSAEMAHQMYGPGGDSGVQRWSDVWSAGHSVSGIQDIPTVAQLVTRLKTEFSAAIDALRKDPRLA